MRAMLKSEKGRIEIEADEIGELRADLAVLIFGILDSYCKDDEDARIVIGGIMEALSVSDKACSVMDIEYNTENDHFKNPHKEEMS